MGDCDRCGWFGTVEPATTQEKRMGKDFPNKTIGKQRVQLYN